MGDIVNDQIRQTDKAKQGLKTCIVSRKLLPREEMFRFVLSPENQLIFDLDEELPGKGVWLEASRDSFDKALKSKAFDKAVKGRPLLDFVSHEHIVNRFKLKCLSFLGFAQKKGDVIHGFEKIESYLKLLSDPKKAKKDSGFTGLLLYADESGVNLDKLQAKARAMGIAEIEGLSVLELSKAIGRDDVVYLYMKGSPLSEKILFLYRKLHKYNGLKNETHKQNNYYENSSFVVKQY
ncbi:MAG: DUF448 domain-containing protein [Alphaproteobacteria bacterium]|nr:DUF448 domain-containing protein [Alphaproteobacteria bacterium]